MEMDGPINHDLTTSWEYPFRIVSYYAKFLILIYPMSTVAMLGTLLFSCLLGVVRFTRSHMRAKLAKKHVAVLCTEQVPCCPDGAAKVVEDAVRYMDVVQHDE